MDQDSNMRPENPFQPLVGLANRVANRVNRLAGLSSLHTQTMVERLTHQGEHNQVWAPDLGPLSPHMVERFSSAIVQRFPNLTNKYLVETPNEKSGEQEEENDLVLSPGGSVGPAIWNPEPGSPPQLPGGEPQERPGLPASTTPAPPLLMIRASEPVQRKANVRPISRIEEMKPGVSSVTGPISTPPGKPDLQTGELPRESTSTQVSGEQRLPEIVERPAAANRVEPIQTHPDQPVQRSPLASIETGVVKRPTNPRPSEPDAASLNVERVPDIRNTPAGSVETLPQSFPSGEINAEDRSVTDAHEPISRELPDTPVTRLPEAHIQKAQPTSTPPHLPSLVPTSVLMPEAGKVPQIGTSNETIHDVGSIKRKVDLSQPSMIEPKADRYQPSTIEPKPDLTQPSPIEPLTDAAVSVQQSVNEVQPLVNDGENNQPRAPRPPTEVTEGKYASTVQPKRELPTAQLPADHASLPLAPVAPSVVQRKETHSPVAQNQPESPRPAAQRSISEVIDGQETQTLEPIQKLPPPSVPDLPLARSEKPVPPAESHQTPGDSPILIPPTMPELNAQLVPPIQTVPPASEPPVHFDIQQQSHLASDQPTQSEPPAQSIQPDTESPAHFDTPVQKLPLAGRPLPHLERPQQTPTHEVEPLLPSQAPAQKSPASDTVAHPETPVQKKSLTGEPLTPPDTRMPTPRHDNEPVENSEPHKQIHPPASELGSVQKLPLAGEQVVQPKLKTHAQPPVEPPLAHLETPVRSIPPAGEPVTPSETATQPSPRSGELLSADSHPGQPIMAAKLPEMPVLHRKPVESGNIEPSPADVSDQQPGPPRSDKEISPAAHIRRDVELPVQRLPLAPVDLDQPIRNAAQPEVSEIRLPDRQLSDSAPDQSATEPRIQRKIETSQPRQLVSQEPTQSTTAHQPSQPAVQKPADASQPGQKPASGEVKGIQPGATEFSAPNLPVRLDNPERVDVPETPELPNLKAADDPRVNSPVLRRRVDDTSKESEQSPVSTTDELPQKLPPAKPTFSPRLEDPVRIPEQTKTPQNRPVQPAPGLEHTLLAKAAARIQLPLTVQRREIGRKENHQKQFRTSIPADHQEARSISFIQPNESPAVLPQARFELQNASDESLLPSDDGPGTVAQLTSIHPYPQAERSHPLAQRQPLPIRALGPAVSEGRASHDEPTSSDMDFRDAAPPAEHIQRMLASGAFNQPVVQPKEVDQPVVDNEIPLDEEEKELDLDQLARDIYPIIKRMLAIERERMKGR